MKIHHIFCGALAILLLAFAIESGAGSVPPCGFDVNKVYQARRAGVPKQALIDHLNAAKDKDLDEKRRAFILDLIEEAYSKDARDFADDAFPRCGSQI